MNDRLIAPEIDRPDARRLFGQGCNGILSRRATGPALFARQFSGRDEADRRRGAPDPGSGSRAGDTPVSLQWGHVFVAFGETMLPPTALRSASSCTRWLTRT